MKRYAVIENGLVTNTILASSLDVAESVTSSTCIFVTEETGEPHAGLSYSNGTFEQPEIEEPEPILHPERESTP